MHDPETAGDNRIQAKTALAIGLAIVFAIVVAVQIRACWPDAERTAGAESNGSETDWLDPEFSQLPGLNRTGGDDREADGKWPKVRLSECARYDPFATPDGFILNNRKRVQQEAGSEVSQTEIEITKKRAAQEQVISSLREAGVNAVLKGSKQSTAIVGTQMVRVGEEFEGFRVLAIEPDGIVIERPAVK